MTGTFLNYRRELAVADNGNVPSISRDPPSAPLAQIAPWANEPSLMPSTALLPPSKSFFDECNDSLQVSPLYRPATARTAASDSGDGPWHDNERRPSVASATTIGSQDSSSRASGGKGGYKKLAGFFGEDVSGHGSPHGSEISIPTLGQRENSTHSQRTRNNSLQTNNECRAASPAGSRPRTPLPSSDVVPWVFQDFKVSLYE